MRGHVPPHLQVILDVAPLWAFEQDLALVYTWSAGAAAPPGAEGRTDPDLFARPEDAELLEALKARVLATGEPEQLELPLALGGPERLHRLSLAPRLGADREVVGLAGALAPAAPPAAAPEGAADLVNLLGHELRNAMNPLRMALQLMERRRASGDPRALDSLATATISAERLTLLLEDTLDYTRWRTEAPELDLGTVSLEATLMQAVVRFRILHPEAADRVLLPAPAEDLAVRGDARRLVQLLVSLLDRAIRSSDARAPVKVGLWSTDERVGITITDAGSVLGAETALVVDPLRWASACMAQHRDEPPFAFAVAAQLVHAMGGELSAAPGPEGRGVRVQVSLPRSRVALPRAATPDHQPAPPQRVLVVDDDAGATHALRRLLEAEGHTVAEARTGQECLRLAAGAPFDVILMDLGLPDLPGEEVARRLRASAPQGPRLVALTGRSSEDDRRASLAAGFDLHVVKPAGLQELRRVLWGTPR